MAPHEALDAAAFVASLRRLKEASGLTYRQLEARASDRGAVLAHSTLAGALNRVSLPRAELVSAFLHACGCSAEERGAWLAVHRRLDGGRVPSRPPGPAAPPPSVASPQRPTGPAHSPPLPAVPAQLPADSPAFTGRHTELDQLLFLRPDRPDRPGHDSAAPTIASIDGMAGVGKTALALHVAHRLAPGLPDGQLFVDLHGYTQGVEPMDPALALEGLLRALGIPSEHIPPGRDERAALYRTRLAGTRTLIVLDNTGSEDQVTPLLPGAPGCLVLITSRRRLLGLPDARHVSLDVLPPADAIALFTRPLGATRLAAEPPQRLTEVVELCGRLPLALRIAAARLNSRPAWTLSDLAERLAHHPDRSGEPQDARRSVNAALDLSYRHLTPGQRRTYRLLSLQPGVDTDAHAASALADADVPQTVRVLDGLVDSHLLTEPAPGRYRFHDLVRVHATITAAAEDRETERHAALTRLFDHYARTSSVAMDAVYPHESDERPDTPSTGTPVPGFGAPQRAETWLNDELDNLVAAAHAATHRQPRHTLHQSVTLHGHLRARGRYGDAAALHESAMDVTSTAATAPDTLNHIGEVHYMLGRNNEALQCFEQALDLARATGDRNGELHALSGFGYTQHMLGRYEEAGDHFARGLDLACATGNGKAELFALIGSGQSHLVLGRYEDAARCLKQALDLACAAADRRSELWVQVGLGDLCRGRDSHQEAAEYYGRAMRLARATGERDGEIEAGFGLGRCHHVLGRRQDALACYRTALTIGTELSHPDDQVRAHDGLAHAYQALGHRDQARDHWRTGLEILTRRGNDHTWDPRVTATALRTNLAGRRLGVSSRPTSRER